MEDWNCFRLKYKGTNLAYVLGITKEPVASMTSEIQVSDVELPSGAEPVYVVAAAGVVAALY